MKISLATLPQATGQEVFDHIVINLLTQNKKSQITLLGQTDPVCAYRGDNGTRCGAGWVIADDEYKPEMEHNTWADMVVYFDEVPDTHQRLIIELQAIHDHQEVVVWPICFARLAGQFGLSIESMSLFLLGRKNLLTDTQ